MNLENLQPDRRLCCVCNKQLFGRTDKVFCDIHCKNKYHSDVKKHTKSAAHVSTQLLYKNYQILCLLLGDNCSKFVISKKELQKRGFCFEAISGIKITKNGFKNELFQFSWYYSSGNQIVVSQDLEQSTISPFMYKRWKRTLEVLQTEETVEPVNSKNQQHLKLNC